MCGFKKKEVLLFDSIFDSSAIIRHYLVQIGFEHSKNFNLNEEYFCGLLQGMPRGKVCNSLHLKLELVELLLNYSACFIMVLLSGAYMKNNTACYN